MNDQIRDDDDDRKRDEKGEMNNDPTGRLCRCCAAASGVVTLFALVDEMEFNRKSV